MWPTIRAGRAQQVGSLLVWAEGFSSSRQLPSPWQMSVWAEPEQGVSVCAAGCSPREAQQQLLPSAVPWQGWAPASPPALGRACASMADGWEQCPCLPKVQSCRPLCGPRAAMPWLHMAVCLLKLLCTWAALNLYERKWCILVYLSPLCPSAIAPPSLLNCSP